MKRFSLRILGILPFVLLIMGGSIPYMCYANLFVSIVSTEMEGWQPHMATAAGDGNDARRNPCYGRDGCRLFFYTLDENGLPGGYPSAESYDKRGWSTPRPESEYMTVGEWWRDVRDKTRIVDIPKRNGGPFEPTICTAVAGRLGGEMLVGTLISNCARSHPTEPTCAIYPTDLHVDLTTPSGTDIQGRNIPDVTVECTRDTTISIVTTNNERIPLNGNSTEVVILDWGMGWGKPGWYNMERYRQRTLPLRVKTAGLQGATPGVKKGSAVVTVSFP